jgi:hypothetical protein
MVVGSKEGRIYLLNRDSLGGHDVGADTQIPQSLLLNPTACGAPGFDAGGPMRFYGSPSYWNGNIYWGTVFGPAVQYALNNGMLALQSQSTYIFQGSEELGRGPLPVISANGNTNGIVWTAIMSYPSGNELLLALDATDLSQQLYTSNDAGTRDAMGPGTVFEIPLVINGKVYLSVGAGVTVFGLL